MKNFSRSLWPPLPIPAVYLVDQSGQSKFFYVNPNYKVRLESSVLLAATKAYK